MIELIFVIVILGILAAIAIPKLAATRNDAKVVTELTSASQALQNLGAEYTSQGAFNNYTAVQATKAVKCFTFTEVANSDGNITIAFITDSATSTLCPTAVFNEVKFRTYKNGLIPDGDISLVYSFGSTSVVW